MEYLVFIIAMATFMIVMFATEYSKVWKQEKNFTHKLYEEYGVWEPREYSPERMAHINSYTRRHPKEGQIDDITWNDLGMDDVFKRMNNTLSATGEEYLYYTLRTPKMNEEELEHMETLITFFMEHSKERVELQLLLRKLGYTGKFSLYDYIDNLDFLGERSNTKHILMNILLAVMICLIPFVGTPAVFGLVIVVIANIVSYFKEQGEIDPYIISFSYIMRLIAVGEKVSKLNHSVLESELAKVREQVANLRNMKRGSFWVFSGGKAAVASSNPLDVVMTYVRMVFHIDLMKFNKMLSFLKQHTEQVDELVSTLGYMETCISVGAVRASLVEGYCVPEHTKDEGLQIEKGYHVLLTESVKNDIQTDRGVLLTGSNASGKSTFLKMVALNAIMAQTIHTCTAECYKAPFYYIYSSMSLRDDLSSGESYYIVEIKALKRILENAKQCGGKVLCFVDEVLRGTNTVERIAASTQILKSLSCDKILCFAATHDIELTELLKDYYDNYHFEEIVSDGDIFFPYKLLKGKATSRNAIKLLEIIGYDSQIIENAQLQAENFTKLGIWQLT